MALPHHAHSDIGILQQADPVIQEALTFWTQKCRTNHEERKRLSPSTLVLLHQWDHLVQENGIWYRRVFRPDGAETVFQLLLPAALKEEVLKEVHQKHGHQCIEKTSELMWQQCYWPGMSSDVTRWCQACERYQIAKNT